jgi:release factor glutamine methyltransferase
MPATLQAITQRLERAGVPSPDADAVWLLAHVTGWTPSRLRLEEPALNADQRAQLEMLIQRREAREPLQWILGTAAFGDLELAVRPGVLVPRPETECLLEIVLKELSTMLSTPPQRVVDIGCGSGALALGIKARYPQLEVWATDVSNDAVLLTLENAQALNLELQVRRTSLLDGIEGTFDAIISNPPYLPESDEPTLEPEVRAEPPTALFSGADGLNLARAIAQLSTTRLEHCGLLALELDPRNAPVMRAELEGMGFTARLEADLAGRERFVVARRQ